MESMVQRLHLDYHFGTSVPKNHKKDGLLVGLISLMYVCIYVCMYVCMYVCIYIYIYVCIYIYIYKDRPSG